MELHFDDKAVCCLGKVGSITIYEHPVHGDEAPVLFRVRKDTYISSGFWAEPDMDAAEIKEAHADGLKKWHDRLMKKSQQPTEELTPEGVQFVLPGAERETTPSNKKEQGTLW